MTLSLADQLIFDRHVRAKVDAALVREHRDRPFGPYSPQLTEVLQFLRRNPDPALPRYVLLRVGAPVQWSIGVRPAQHGGRLRQLENTAYPSRPAAEHAIFLRRLADLGVWPAAAVDVGDARSSEQSAAASELPGVMGYLDALSYAPGDSVTLRASTNAAHWNADMVRLLCADLTPEGPPLRESVVDTVPALASDGMLQRTVVGSFVRVDLPEPGLNFHAGFSLRVFVMPTLPGEAAQALVSHRDERGETGWSLRLNEKGAVCLWVGNGSDPPAAVSLDAPLIRGCWYLVAAVVDPGNSILRLACRPVGTRAANRVWMGRGAQQIKSAPLSIVGRSAPPGSLLLGSGWLDKDGQPRERLDGRLELPLVIEGAVQMERLLELEDADAATTVNAFRPAAAWDFAAGIGRTGITRPSEVQDIGPRGWHGRCVNHPTRAVTSHTWDGDGVEFRYNPTRYAAIHFHRDDMTDCDWTPQARIDIPSDLSSGVYAIRLKAKDGDREHIDRVPFIVRPPSDRATAPLLLIMSTNSYLAYANDHVGIESPRVQTMVRHVLEFDEFDQFRHEHRELGASLYEAHPDGTGICYSSSRRPLLTMRPHVQTFYGRAWQFTADLQIIDWLDRSGRPVDVVTDLDVHREGAALLRRYSAVMTGTHPEYPTRQMLDAFGEYLDTGGRMAYMGGNGLYWVTAYDPEDEQVIEIRRWGGSQAWQARPGEYCLSFTGELGGLWRNRGRAPQKTVGVGFVAAGMSDSGAGYVRCLDRAARASWIYAGVESDRFGAAGTSGAAAGLEVDAMDAELGTPANTILLASSGGGHNDDMLEARENYGMTLAAPGGARNSRVRSEMVLLEIAGGGGVFSTGSIAWAGALAHDITAGRILGNVLDRFCSKRPLLD
jgi:N,N-dimethylformamidase